MLDVGCASGAITIDAARLIRPTGRIVGLDPVDEMVDRATSIAGEEGVNNVEFVVGDVQKLPFPDDRFDLVYSTNTFGYIADWSGALVEMKRVTKPGGRVAVRVSEWGSLVMYPACSAVLRVLDAYSEFPTNEGFYFNPCKGRALYHEFQEASLKPLEVTPAAACVYNQGQDSFKPPAVGVFVAGEWARPAREYLIANGLLDEETANKAANEIEQWKSHAGAFMIVSGVAVIGEA